MKCRNKTIFKAYVKQNSWSRFPTFPVMLWNNSIQQTSLLRDIYLLQKLSLVIKRTAIIPAKNGTSRSRRRRIRDVSFDELNLKNIDPHDPKAMEFKLKQLQEFTRNLREHIKVADNSVKKHKAQEELRKKESTKDPAEETADNDAEFIYNKLNAPSVLRQRALPNGAQEVEPYDLSSLILASESNAASKFFPEVLRHRINDERFILSCLLDKAQQNWDGIISKLHATDLQLKGIPSYVLQKSLLSKLDNLSTDSIEKLDKMLLSRIDGDITKFNTSMYECIFYNLAKLKPQSSSNEDMVIKKMKELLERSDSAKKVTGNSKMTQFILNSCIKYATKIMNFENMNFFLTKFKEEYGISPNKENYTKIIQFYTKWGAPEQAWAVFDTMKFLSKSHAPDIFTYNSVLHLCNRDKDYAKAIDLYQEMLDINLEPSVQTLNIMAKTLARASADPVTSENKQESLRLLGWRYIHMIESQTSSKQPDEDACHTLNSMMALAAYDGDVGLARALYFKYCTQRYHEISRKWKGKLDQKTICQKVLDPELFNYLLLSYANYSSRKLPILLGYEQGIKFRRNLLNSVDYTGRITDDDENKLRLPMLPTIDLDNPTQILMESRALWQFNLEFGGLLDLRLIPTDLTSKDLKEMASSSSSLEQFKFKIMEQIAQWKYNLVNHSILNTISLTSFLTIAIKAGDKNEFLLRMKEFTFQQHELENNVQNLYNKTLHLEDRGTAECANRNISMSNDFTLGLSYFAAMKHKIIANSTIYELMMKAAAAFNDIELASKAWTDRGEFRKTLAFKNMEEKRRIKSDTDFATLMVQFFSSQKLFSDALRIIMTSQKYVNWQYPMIKTLHKGLIEIEDQKSIEILLDIVNRKSGIQAIDEQIRELEF